MNLSSDERAFLRHLLAEHREYYGILASNPQCTPANRERWRFINQLWRKLGDEQMTIAKQSQYPDDGTM